MNDDLISRKELIKSIEKIQMHITGIRSGKSILADMLEQYAKAVKKTIKEHPVAYNVDKVVEQLEEARQFIAKNDYCKQINSNEDCNDRDCFLCCADYLIDIVKRGGTDGNDN